MDFKRYENTMPCPSHKDRHSPDVEACLEAGYQAEQSRLYRLFKQDALAEVGLADHPKKDLIYSKAWQDGHSGGYSEVFGHLLNLAGFVAQLEAK